MKKQIYVYTLLSVVMLSSSLSNAAVVSGVRTDFNQIWEFGFNVTASTAGDHTFNMLAYEDNVDLFGDGRIEDRMDTYLSLFDSAGDKIAENDDAGTLGAPGDDGSTSGVDSYLSTSLGAGYYTIVLSSCCRTSQTLQLMRDIARAKGLVTKGDEWQLTTNANISTVPVPAAVWLMGSGLLGLMGFSRNKKAPVVAV